MKNWQNNSTTLILGFILTSLSLSCTANKPQNAFLQNIKEDSSFICPEKEPEGCWQIPQCQLFCDETFVHEVDLKQCHNWPISIFSDFKNLIETINTKPFENIKLQVLKCFLDFSKENKNMFLKLLNEEKAKDILITVASDPLLASILVKTDGNLSILHGLYKKIGTRNTAIKKELVEQDNFLTLLTKHENQAAWHWLNNYISYRCKEDSACQEPLEYYCEILEDIRHSGLTVFLENRQFKNEYKVDIESKTCGGATSCQYGNLLNFKEVCSQF